MRTERRPDATAYVAMSMILGVLGGVVVTKDSLVSSNEGIVWWMVWAISTGALINFRHGLPRRWLICGSLFGPLALLGVIVYRAYYGDLLKISGRSVDAIEGADIVMTSAPWLIIIYVTSVTAVFISALARDVIVPSIARLVREGPEGIERVDKVLGAFVKVAGTLALLIAAIAA